MKIWLSISSLLFFNIAFSQINDDFSDKDFSMHPTWNGSTDAFIVHQKTLQLKSRLMSNAGKVFLSTENKLATNVRWTFFVQLNFNPSTANQVRIYLISDQKDLSSALNGYFIQIGEPGATDAYHLYRQAGTKVHKIIHGRKKIRSDPDQLIAHIQVTRSAAGRWELKVDNTGGDNYISEGTTIDRTWNNTAWFGVQCKYTAARSGGFIFDNFLVEDFPSDDANLAAGILTKKIEKEDILISEVLFNPRKDGVDFVEIYNNSLENLDLKDLFLASTNKDGLEKIYPVSKETYLLQPKQYLVLSTDPHKVKQQYRTENPNAFLKVKALPPFNNDAGTVILLSHAMRIDELSYSANMHFALIKNREGISLERSHFDRSANEPANFRSAASSTGFATPGYKNSQYSESNYSKNEFLLVSKTFSPDEDGFEDMLEIKYKLTESLGVVNVNIYNDQGVLVKQLIRNQTLATAGVITWDGSNDRAIQAPIGIYIIHTEIFDLDGNTKQYQQNCVLAKKLGN